MDLHGRKTRLRSLGRAEAQPLQHLGADYTSRITGRINGRLEVCLLMWRFRSTRIFSFITDQSDFSSALDCSTVLMTTSRAPARNSVPLSLNMPRVTISGCDSMRPVCLSI